MAAKALSRRERADRDASILKLFLAGVSDREIAARVDLTPVSVARVVRREIADAAAHRDLLSEEAVAIYVDRLELLIRAAWPKALTGDPKMIEVARRLLAQQAAFYGIDEVSPGPVPPISDNELADEDDELAAYRARYRHREAAQ